MIDMQKEEWLSLMLRELPDRLLIMSAEGIVMEAFGEPSASYPSASRHLIGQHFRQLLPDQIIERFTHHFSQALSSNTRNQLHYSLRVSEQLQMSIEALDEWQEHEQRWFEANLKPITLSNGLQYVLWQEREVTQSYLQHTELKKLAETDELTGILNRRAFMAHLEREFDRPHQRHFSCLMIDIDHFKEINDQVGHLSGDEVITQVAQICKTMVRSHDHIGRLGGEEFGVLLTDTNAIQAYDIAERIRQSVASTPCHVDGHVIVPTVSIGIAELNTQVASVRELMVQADKAMYYSKQTGRDQVTLYYDNLPQIKTNTNLNVNIRRAS
ncbi:GGDEF domain-containing protein [Vibrio sp. JPW-9-11-11]|uniref:GGDEF domain-containing protein n=1 Tax=Vibrio sp. JPW-9-11-11 TaxID=1416532 RepID=UPI001594ADDC|nr:GGDEF domain-containing protein [Vibrio sp. JPW-9-11-11]NVD05425.1 GGDEF domain-containing protein [Vibrio sp. JPW-9-11-11]